MSIATSTWRNGALFGLIALFAVIIICFSLAPQLFYVAAACAVPFGLLGLVLTTFTLRLHDPPLQRTVFLVTGISAAGIPISAILHNLVYALAILLFGDSFWSNGSDEPFFFILAIIVCPLLFLVGAITSTILLIRSKILKANTAPRIKHG